jgi:RNA polymerase sigma-70 factor (ECF subfamily)
MAQRLLGTRSDAEDLVHDLFLEVWLRADSYDASRASVRTWLLLRLRSRALDRLKSAAWRLAATSTPLTGPDEPLGKLAAGLNLDPEAELMLRATQTTVRGALRQLTAEEQRLIDLVYVHGATLVAVAGQIDAPLGTVKSRLNRVLGKLRTSLAKPRNEV